MKRLIILIGILVSELVFGMSVRAEEPISPVSVVTMQAVPKVIIEEGFGTNWNEIGDGSGATFLEVNEPFYPGTPSLPADRCLAVNSQGKIYLFDIVNNRIKKYDNDGKYLKSIPVKSWLGQVTNYNYAGEIMVFEPTEYIGKNIAIDEEDNLYYYYIHTIRIISKGKTNYVKKGYISQYSPEDKLIRTWETNVMDEFKIDKSYLDKKAYYYAVQRCKIRLESTTNGTNKYIITDPDGTEKTLLSTITLGTDFCGITRDGYYRIFGGEIGIYYWGFYFDKNLELKKVVNDEYPYGKRGNDENLYLLKVNQEETILRMTRWQLEVMNGKQK